MTLLDEKIDWYLLMSHCMAIQRPSLVPSLASHNLV